MFGSGGGLEIHISEGTNKVDPVDSLQYPVDSLQCSENSLQ